MKRQLSIRELAKKYGIDLTHRDASKAQAYIDWLTKKPMVEQ
jgi:hypothetical protein